MTLAGGWANMRRNLAHAFAVFGRRAHGAPNSLTVQPYRGYGTHEEIFLIGRVFRPTRLPEVGGGGLVGRGLMNLLRRALQWACADASVVGTFAGHVAHVTTDRDGYFRFHLRLPNPLVSQELWHRVPLQAAARDGSKGEASAHVFVPPRQAKYVVISDIDDTVVVTGVANKIKMMWRLFFAPAQSRVAYPGVAAFYRALHAGAGRECAHNPIIYVSRGPWSLYEVLDEFFRLHDIPVGPILFLREWGLTLQRPLPPKAEDHKQQLIRRMLELYDELPFILIGDSGQHDPEIYADVVRENPRRVAAVYIRNVSRDRRRADAIEALAKEVAEAGSTLMLANDTAAMAAHAYERGLIDAEGLAAVVGDPHNARTPNHAETRTVRENTAPQTRAAVERGDLGETLAEAQAQSAPVIVESRQEGPGPQRARTRVDESS